MFLLLRSTEYTDLLFFFFFTNIPPIINTYDGFWGLGIREKFIICSKFILNTCLDQMFADKLKIYIENLSS